MVRRESSCLRGSEGASASEDCIMRMATLEDVFLRLTGRELRE